MVDGVREETLAIDGTVNRYRMKHFSHCLMRYADSNRIMNEKRFEKVPELLEIGKEAIRISTAFA